MIFKFQNFFYVSRKKKKGEGQRAKGESVVSFSFFNFQSSIIQCRSQLKSSDEKQKEYRILKSSSNVIFN